MGESKPIVLRSSANPTVRHLVRLRDNRARRKLDRVIVDGWRETNQAIESGMTLVGLYVAEPSESTSGTDSPLIEGLCHLASSAGKLQRVSSQIMQKIAYGQSPRGCVAEFERPQRAITDLDPPSDPLVLVLDRIEKPGNVGAIFRCADAAGVDAVLLCECGDVWNPNAIRSSQGCVFHVPSSECSQSEIAGFLQAHSVRLVAARVESSQLLWETSLAGGVAILLGSEAHGLGERWQQIDETTVAGVRIPMAGSIDSLNVSVSAAVILYEAVRQRMKQP
ncbi:MAG: TrmH family RNA methyltransferase [Planctomycetota bacterium]